MTPPRNIKQVHAFVVLVKYYRDIWARRLNLIRPLTALTSTKVTFKWTDVEQKAFDKIKQIVSRDTLLIYPDFNKRFDIFLSFGLATEVPKLTHYGVVLFHPRA